MDETSQACDGYLLNQLQRSFYGMTEANDREVSSKVSSDRDHSQDIYELAFDEVLEFMTAEFIK